MDQLLVSKYVADHTVPKAN